MRKILVIAITVLFIAASCKEKPVADFSWSPQEPVTGEEVEFTNLSQNAKSYDWNFGDMSVGREKNPIHVYERPGIYIIDLLAHKGLMSDEKTLTIVIILKQK